MRVLVALCLVAVLGAVSGKYCKRDKMGCAGHDILSVWKWSLHSCQRFCDRTDGCLSIAYHSKRFYVHTINCYIKRHVCRDEELSPQSEDSGGADYFKVADEEDCQYKGCKRSGKGCGGHDIENGNYSFEECRQKCFDNDKCLSFSHHEANLGCRMKNYVCQDSELSDISGTRGSDYVKVSRWADCS